MIRLFMKPASMKKNRFHHLKQSSDFITLRLPLLLLPLLLFLGKSAWGAPADDPLSQTPFLLEETQKKPSLRFQNFRPRFKELENGRYITRFENGVTATYTLDPFIQQRIENYLKRYRVPYGAFVAINPKTGKILALADYSEREPRRENLFLAASYPAASIFKLVTAAAAIEKHQLSADFLIAYRGKFNRLTPALWKDDPKKDTLEMSFADAFAESNNIIFAKIAHRWLDIPTLLDYGARFYFNHSIPFESDVEISNLAIGSEEGALEKTAAGFGKVGLSPVHAALIGSAIANNGVMMRPCLVNFISDKSGEPLYACTPGVLSQTISADTAKVLRGMMERTVQNGTVKDIFEKRHLDRRLRNMKIGGKTGSLRGKNPRGRYTWFIGMTPLDDPEIVVAALIVNDPRWHIQAPHVAKEGLAAYFESRAMQN